MAAPVLETPRLRLRGHTMADLDALCVLLGSERAIHMDGPVPSKEAWRWLASEVGMWDLLGFGAWGIETKEGDFLGQISISKPPHYPEAEMGWTLLEAAEGKGYASEAALAALDWAWSNGFETLVSYISPANARSIALAKRLGATIDADAALPEGETSDETIVYRHTADSDGSPEAYA